MFRKRAWVGIAVWVMGCASTTPPPAAPPAPSPGAGATPAAPVASAPPPAESAPAPAPAQAQQQMTREGDPHVSPAERAKWEADTKAEAERWTPKLRADVAAIAGKAYPDGRTALQASLHGPQRKPADAARDKYRHPLETLELFGFKPTMAVLDVGPGEGWYTQILAPALAKQGRYVATSGDPNAADERTAFNAQRFRGFLEGVPEAYAKVETVVVDSKAPHLDKDSAFDLVIVMRGVHGMVNGGTLGTWLGEIHRALKPGGVLGIEQHRAPEGADPVASAKKGYVPEKWLVEQVEAAGFKLAGKSDVNANPKDTKDYPEGVWALPPTFRLGDRDHDKYAAIGESDRMTLKFVKKAK